MVYSKRFKQREDMLFECSESIVNVQLAIERSDSKAFTKSVSDSLESLFEIVRILAIKPEKPESKDMSKLFGGVVE